MKFYANVITLLLFLILRLPGLRERVDFSRASSSDDNAMAGGLAAIVVRATVHTTELWVGTSQIIGASNWVRVLRMPLLAGGTLLVVSGLALLQWVAFRASAPVPHEARA